MKVNQIYEIVNSASKQAYGDSAIVATDLSGLIAMGDTVLSTEKNVDAFCKALADRIGRTIVRNRVYTAKAMDMLMDSMEFGVAVQKVYIAPEDAGENGAWEIAEGDTLGPGTIHLPTVEVSTFENRDTWKYTICIPTYQVKSAFLNAEAMASFISGIYNSVETSMNIAIEAMNNLCRANFIGEKLAYQESEDAKGIHAINLLHEYNTETNNTLTVDAALKDKEFLKYACARILDVKELMKKPSKLYNTKGHLNFTAEDMEKVVLVDKFARASAMYLSADTFNSQFVELPGYESVSYWQGVGEGATFDEVTTISITTASGEEVEQSGVIGVIYDRDAIGTMFDEMHTTTYLDPEKDIEKLWFKSDKGYFNDLGENGVVFYLAEV